MEDLFSDARWPAVRALALAEGASPRQTQKWRDRGRISADWRIILANRAERDGDEKLRRELLSTASRSVA